MKILHLADTHLGFRQFSGKLHPERRLNQRECDVYDAWHRAVDVAIERDVDAVVHAGDLFDSARPSPRAMAEALDGFGRLRDADIPVVAIAGNHSTPRFRSGGSVFEVLDRFGLLTAWQEPRTIRVKDVAFHAVPHEADAAQLRADIESLEPDASAAANVLILHAGLEAVPRNGYGEANEIELDPEVIARAPFDYVALGHLHRFQVPQFNAVYPGSLERLDFADVEGDKAVLEVDLGAGAGSDGFLVRHPLPTRPMIDLALDCDGCDPATVTANLEAELAGRTLEGAMVRVRLNSLQRDVYHALDFARIDDLLSPCLHYSLPVGREGLHAHAGQAPEELAFGPFARSRMPAGLDPERVIGIAQGYLDAALSAEAEQEAAS